MDAQICSALSDQEFFKQCEEGLQTAVLSFPRLGISFVNGTRPPEGVIIPSKNKLPESVPEASKQAEASQPTAIMPFPQQDSVSCNGEGPAKVEEPEPGREEQSSVQSQESQQERERNLAFWHSTLEKAHLSVYARAVYTHLVMRGKDAFPSITTIAKSCRCSRDSVIKAILELKQIKLIDVKRTGRANHYLVRSLEQWQAQRLVEMSTDQLVDISTSRHIDQSTTPTSEVAMVDSKDIQLKKSNIDIHSEGSFASASKSERKPKKQKSNRATEREIIEYCVSRGLLKTDGQWLFAKLEGNGWTNGSEDRPIKSWKGTIVQWQLQGNIFPSQKPNPKPRESSKQQSEPPPVENSSRNGHSEGNGWQPPTKQEVFAYARSRKWSPRFTKHCWSKFVADGWTHYNRPITSDEQWQAIMDVTEYNP
jgi:hypothetical protein